MPNKYFLYYPLAIAIPCLMNLAFKLGLVARLWLHVRYGI